MLDKLRDAQGVDRPITQANGQAHLVTTEHLHENGWTLRVRFGIRYITGNSQPYFTLTCDELNGRGVDQGGGAAHKLIVEHFPELADLAALHLSGIDGKPSYYQENGWHWLAKAAGVPQKWGPDQDADECLEIFARHCRISQEEAEQIVRVIQEHEGDQRQKWNLIANQMIPRWEREAQAAIDKYGLQVFGDSWESRQIQEMRKADRIEEGSALDQEGQA